MIWHYFSIGLQLLTPRSIERLITDQIIHYNTQLYNLLTHYARDLLHNHITLHHTCYIIILLQWILVQSHHCHLKTTQALKHIRQAWEISSRKSRLVNHDMHMDFYIVYFYSNWLVLKSLPCHLVWTRPVFANLVTFFSNIKYCICQIIQGGKLLQIFANHECFTIKIFLEY